MNMISKVQADGSVTDTVLGRRWRWAGLITLGVVIAAAAWALLHREAPAVAAAPPPVVEVVSPLVRAVIEWDDYVGRFEASQSVEVRPRVSGAVTAVHFTDGAMVGKGQLLFTIDPRPYAAALAEARASVASAASDLALATANLDRANRLVTDDAVSTSDLDQLRARVRAATAALAASRARVEARALDLEFTRVRAPIAGRISDRRIDAGNLVSAGDTGGTLLTTINALDPIHFTFDASEALFLKSKRSGSDGASVEVKLQDETDYARTGRLDFTDNGLNPRSGTVRARAVLSNADLFLTPGMFGNMRLANGATAQALLVPDTAIQTDQARKIVLTVGRDGIVSARPVTLGPVVEGLRIVRTGLSLADRVIVNGTQLASPGSKVAVRAGRIATVRAGTTPPPTPPADEASFATR
ncbi:efflux RND transporter periplasmic adaptor subunit [Allosphingosinicella indica]|uniref:RND family efflux transporter, MFP subunit n=1 Tax=Allosphingosinicella indica TaxID=941907 RepID=A0A1X7FY72_9SPHN|nr:efflux RND transporter periplasmic adaptor subunit [Allosphingosinicella indica]SMF60882.1 RND family efflux transporter, MFP subunit [Allosphingosinicella indica]